MTILMLQLINQWQGNTNLLISFAILEIAMEIIINLLQPADNYLKG